MKEAAAVMLSTDLWSRQVCTHITDASHVGVCLASLQQLCGLNHRLHHFQCSAIMEPLVTQPLLYLAQVIPETINKYNNTITGSQLDLLHINPNESTHTHIQVTHPNIVTYAEWSRCVVLLRTCEVDGRSAAKDRFVVNNVLMLHLVSVFNCFNALSVISFAARMIVQFFSLSLLKNTKQTVSDKILIWAKFCRIQNYFTTYISII